MWYWAVELYNTPSYGFKCRATAALALSFRIPGSDRQVVHLHLHLHLPPPPRAAPVTPLCVASPGTEHILCSTPVSPRSSTPMLASLSAYPFLARGTCFRSCSLVGSQCTPAAHSRSISSRARACSRRIDLPRHSKPPRICSTTSLESPRTSSLARSTIGRVLAPPVEKISAASSMLLSPFASRRRWNATASRTRQSPATRPRYSAWLFVAADYPLPDD